MIASPTRGRRAGGIPRSSIHERAMSIAAAGAIPTIDVRGRQMMRIATYASVFVAFVLIMAKTAAWVDTDSVAMLSSLVDSILDAVASLLNLFAVRQALAPADAEHRFGHGK